MCWKSVLLFPADLGHQPAEKDCPVNGARGCSKESSEPLCQRGRGKAFHSPWTGCSGVAPDLQGCRSLGFSFVGHTAPLHRRVLTGISCAECLCSGFCTQPRCVALHHLPDKEGIHNLPGASGVLWLCGEELLSRTIPFQCSGIKSDAQCRVRCAVFLRTENFSFWKTVSSQITTPFLEPWSDVNTKCSFVAGQMLCDFCLFAEKVPYEILHCYMKQVRQPCPRPSRLCLPHPAVCNLSDWCWALFCLL